MVVICIVYVIDGICWCVLNGFVNVVNEFGCYDEIRGFFFVEVVEIGDDILFVLSYLVVFRGDDLVK